MITYRSGGIHFFTNTVKIHGSVFPKAMLFSIPASAATALFVLSIHEWNYLKHFAKEDSVMTNNAIWGGFTFLVGFLAVFRTSQAYSRFWEGCTSTHKMGAEWFDCCSSLMAFCKHSKAPQSTILEFQNTLVRLFSMLHAAALGEIEDNGGPDTHFSDVEAFKMELIDADSLSPQALKAVRNSNAKVELIFQWIQQLIVENIHTEVLNIPPPILSRSFQEIANGMVYFHDAMKISNVPFPFPYAQTCDCLLLLHLCVVPFIVSQWVTKAWWAALFSFIQVFTLWTLNLIAVELENPFGTDANDVDGGEMQLEMNNHLRLLLHIDTLQTPGLCSGFERKKDMNDYTRDLHKITTFEEMWLGMSDTADTGVARRYSMYKPLRRQTDKIKRRSANAPHGSVSLSVGAEPNQSQSRGSRHHVGTSRGTASVSRPSADFGVTVWGSIEPSTTGHLSTMPARSASVMCRESETLLDGEPPTREATGSHSAPKVISSIAPAGATSRGKGVEVLHDENLWVPLHEGKFIAGYNREAAASCSATVTSPQGVNTSPRPPCTALDGSYTTPDLRPVSLFGELTAGGGTGSTSAAMSTTDSLGAPLDVDRPGPDPAALAASFAIAQTLLVDESIDQNKRPSH